jgi:hypothetical protein
LKSDGSIVGWGNNTYGQCDVPEPNTDFIAMSGASVFSESTGIHCLGLKSDGSIVGWGDNTHGQCDVPEPNADFLAVAAGAGYSMALKPDGSVITWGIPIDDPVPNSDFEFTADGGWIGGPAPVGCPLAVRTESPVAVGDQEESFPTEQLPPVTQLFGAYPNPFNPQTTIAFTLDRTQHVIIDVFSMKGGRVRELIDNTFADGEHQITWDGRDAYGQSVPSGTYVIRLATETAVQARKVMLLR